MVVTLQQKRINQNYTDMKEELTLAGNALFNNERMNAVLTDGSNCCGSGADVNPRWMAAINAGRAAACNVRGMAAVNARRAAACNAGRAAVCNVRRAAACNTRGMAAVNARGMAAVNARRMVARAAGWLVAPVARYYSRVLGEKVSTRQTLLLLNAQAAFVMAVLPADGPLAGRAVCVAWLAHALLLCRRSGLRTSC